MNNIIRDKIKSLEEAIVWRAALRSAGRKLVMTNGCFDILHRGHADYLLAAREQGDALLLAMNSDASVRELKGPTRPINHQDDRAFLIACLAFVDAVTLFNSRRCDAILAAIAPDIYVKGGDYTLETLDPVERAALLKVGADIRFIPFTPGHSTTGLLEKSKRA